MSVFLLSLGTIDILMPNLFEFMYKKINNKVRKQ